MVSGSGAPESAPTPELEATLANTDNVDAPPKRPSRTLKPSQKALEAQQNLEIAQAISKRPSNHAIRITSPNEPGQRAGNPLDLIDIGKAIVRKVEEIAGRILSQMEELKKKKEERANRLEGIVRAQQAALKELQQAFGETKAELQSVNLKLQ